MVERILEQVQAIKRVFAQDKSCCPLPQLTWQDINVLETVNSGLKPVAEFTDILSGENYVTVSSLLPMLVSPPGKCAGELGARCETHSRPGAHHLGADGRQIAMMPP
ncbi:hypothetical protein QQF64_020129 [Cirrhinus molitorella]|uniref:Uncharacterized protein n=1 Tax=Cirrhinus molitorella TaxID=172907 RepID=A0ABR3L868_9TELE